MRIEADAAIATPLCPRQENGRPMPSQTVDAIVLGAGIVGVSAALALSARGRSVALIDRLPEAAGETSFGNSGIVQTEGVLPYLFPRAPGEIARAAMNRDPRAHIRHGALPSIAPALLRYFQASTQTRKTATGEVMAPLLSAAAGEHLKFAQERGRLRAFALRRLDQGLSQRARAGSRAWRGRGAQAFRRQAGFPRPRRAHGARAACRREGDRRRALRRAAVDVRSGRAHPELCGPVRQARRADGAGRRAEPRTFERGLDGHDRFGAPRCPRRRHRARAVVRRARAALRPSPAVLRQARLSHALRGQGQRRPHPPGARPRARLSRDPDGARA